MAVPHNRRAIRIEAETNVNLNNVGLLQTQEARLLQRSLRLGARTTWHCVISRVTQIEWHQLRLIVFASIHFHVP